MNKTIIIKNPSPKLKKFMDIWAKRQQETIKKLKYEKVIVTSN